MKLRNYVASAAIASTGMAMYAPLAHAQMHADLSPALRYMELVEYNAAGRSIVRENGWLPGVGAALEYEWERLAMFARASAFRAAVGYDGRLQNGGAHKTHTDTELGQAQLGIRMRVLEATSAYAALAYDLWNRNIRGDGRAVGLRERTRSTQLMLGVEHQWRMTNAILTMGASLIRARPERLRVDSSGLFDNVSLRTQAATGYGIMLAYQPHAFPNVSVGMHIDTMKIGRSKAYPVTRNSVLAGTITQPEHVRRNATLFVNYRF